MEVSPFTCDSELTGSFEPHIPFVFAFGREALLAFGARRVGSPDAGSWSAQFDGLRPALDDGRGAPVIVGALPFDHERPGHLFQAQTLSRLAGDAAIDEFLGGASSLRPLQWQLTPQPSLAEYRANVAAIVELLNEPDTALRKVVLARSLLLRADAPIDVARVLQRLRADPSVTVFAVPLPGSLPGAARTLVGATPELLIDKSGSRLVSQPLAGSAARSHEPAADRAAAEELLRSDKDRREHETVVEWIADRLAPFCLDLRVPASPSLVSTRSVWHLATRVEGTLRDDTMPSIALAEVLHPTPAVCGVPRDAATAVIGRYECFDREYFTGAVGWCDARGDGRWMMAIRCGEVVGATARLYAGAGIVAGSEPASEGAETSIKFRALLDALDVAEDGGSPEQEPR